MSEDYKVLYGSVVPRIGMVGDGNYPSVVDDVEGQITKTEGLKRFLT